MRIIKNKISEVKYREQEKVQQEKADCHHSTLLNNKYATCEKKSHGEIKNILESTSVL